MPAAGTPRANLMRAGTRTTSSVCVLRWICPTTSRSIALFVTSRACRVSKFPATWSLMFASPGGLSRTSRWRSLAKTFWTIGTPNFSPCLFRLRERRCNTACMERSHGATESARGKVAQWISGSLDESRRSRRLAADPGDVVGFPGDARVCASGKSAGVFTQGRLFVQLHSIRRVAEQQLHLAGRADCHRRARRRPVRRRVGSGDQRQSRSRPFLRTQAVQKDWRNARVPHTVRLRIGGGGVSRKFFGVPK